MKRYLSVEPELIPLDVGPSRTIQVYFGSIGDESSGHLDVSEDDVRGIPFFDFRRRFYDEAPGLPDGQVGVDDVVVYLRGYDRRDFLACIGATDYEDDRGVESKFFGMVRCASFLGMDQRRIYDLPVTDDFIYRCWQHGEVSLEELETLGFLKLLYRIRMELGHNDAVTIGKAFDVGVWRIDFCGEGISDIKMPRMLPDTIEYVSIYGGKQPKVISRLFEAGVPLIRLTYCDLDAIKVPAEVSSRIKALNVDFATNIPEGLIDKARRAGVVVLCLPPRAIETFEDMGEFLGAADERDAGLCDIGRLVV